VAEESTRGRRRAISDHLFSCCLHCALQCPPLSQRVRLQQRRYPSNCRTLSLKMEVLDNLADFVNELRFSEQRGLVAPSDISRSGCCTLLGTELLQVGEREPYAFAGRAQRKCRNLREQAFKDRSQSRDALTVIRFTPCKDLLAEVREMELETLST